MRRTPNPEDFWKFTDEEMETAKNTDLPDLLEHLGYSVRRVGSRYHTTKIGRASCRERVF